MSAGSPPARAVAFAFLAAGALLAAAGLALTLGGGRPAPHDIGTLPFWIWVAAAAAGVGGWYALWQRAVAGPAGAALPRLAAAWALLVLQLAVALASALLGGTPMLLVPAFTLLALGILLSLPR